MLIVRPTARQQVRTSLRCANNAVAGTLSQRCPPSLSPLPTMMLQLVEADLLK